VTNENTNSIAGEIKTLAITSAVTNQRLLELAGTQQKLTEAVATLVKSNLESEIRHANFEQKVISMMEGMESIRTDIPSCNLEIKKNSERIASVKTSIIVNKHTISAHWKMIAGAVSIAVASFGAALFALKMMGK